ncbi:MAG TPA: YetF domain-containing protein [Polyangiales bacterium]
MSGVRHHFVVGGPTEQHPPALQTAAIRGSPRPLVRDGQIDFGALEDEALSPDDLMAGLRKLGYATPDVIHLAVLEETGQISAIARRTYAAVPERDTASTCDGGTEVFNRPLTA